MYFFYFYCLNVHISLTMYIIYLKLCACTENIVMEGTVSQIFYTAPDSFLLNVEKIFQKIRQK